MPAIFISHSSRDGTIADDIKSALAQMGFDRVFLDFDKDSGIGAGEDWEKRLYEELSRCHAVILVITPSWLGSKWCFAELAQARALGKVILPAICAPLSEPIVLPGIRRSIWSIGKLADSTASHSGSVRLLMIWRAVLYSTHIAHLIPASTRSRQKTQRSSLAATTKPAPLSSGSMHAAPKAAHASS